MAVGGRGGRAPEGRPLRRTRRQDRGLGGWPARACCSFPQQDCTARGGRDAAAATAEEAESNSSANAGGGREAGGRDGVVAQVSPDQAAQANSAARKRGGKTRRRRGGGMRGDDDRGGERRVSEERGDTCPAPTEWGRCRRPRRLGAGAWHNKRAKLASQFLFHAYEFILYLYELNLYDIIIVLFR